MELVLVEGQLVIRPITEPQWTLEELLSGVTEDNVHHEISNGAPVGKEAWRTFRIGAMWYGSRSLLK